jgi:hypothetical protein
MMTWAVVLILGAQLVSVDFSNQGDCELFRAQIEATYHQPVPVCRLEQVV